MRRRVTLVACALAGCASDPATTDAGSWDHVCVEGLGELAAEMAGPNARDCGFLDTVGGDVSTRARRAGVDCARRAISAGSTFKFGVRQLPLDSYVHQIVLRDPEGQLWYLWHDVMVDGDAAQFVKYRCDSLVIDGRHLSFDLDHCEPSSE